MHSHPLVQHREEQGNPVRIHASGHAARTGIVRPAYKGLKFDEDRSRSFNTTYDNRSGGPGRSFGKEELGGIGDRYQTFVRHFEDAQLIGRTKPVFHGPNDSMAVIPFAFEI